MGGANLWGVGLNPLGWGLTPWGGAAPWGWGGSKINFVEIAQNYFCVTQK